MVRPPIPALRCVWLLVLCPFAVLAVVPVPDAFAKDARIEAAVRILKDKAGEPFGQLDRQKAIRSLGKVGGREAAKALLPLFEDPFVHLRDHAVSAWITMLKGEKADETRTWLAKQAEKSRTGEVRRGAIVALGIAGGEEALPLLATLVERRHKREKLAANLVELARALGRRGATMDDGLGTLLDHKEGAVALAVADAVLPHDEALRRAAADRLRTSGAGTSNDAYRRAALVLLDPQPQNVGDGSSYVRIVLTEALGRGWGDVDALLPGLLQDSSWPVRASAIRQMERRGDLAAVPHLVERIPVEMGRLRLDLVRALQRLTGAEIGGDAELWRAWWKAHEESGRAAGGAAGPAKIPDGESETREASFFRLPIRSKRIAFLLDASGSMRDPADPAKPTGPTKWDVAREELQTTLEALQKDVQFDVFVYRYPSDFPPRARMGRALGRLESASSAHVKKAVRWLSKQDARGWGAFSDAFQILFEQPIDTVYFLSDGRPSRGRFDRDFRLLQELERWNRFGQRVIHTVLTGHKKDDRRFLENLATATGGMFQDGASGGPKSR